MSQKDEELTAVKHDLNKQRFDLIPISSLNALAEVLAFGAKKYGDNNWKKGLHWSRCYAAALRHGTSFWNGEDLDPESGLPHLYHWLCNIVFLIEYFQNHKELDDRYTTECERKAKKELKRGLKDTASDFEKYFEMKQTMRDI